MYLGVSVWGFVLGCCLGLGVGHRLTWVSAYVVSQCRTLSYVGSLTVRVSGECEVRLREEAASRGVHLSMVLRERLGDRPALEWAVPIRGEYTPSSDAERAEDEAAACPVYGPVELGSGTGEAVVQPDERVDSLAGFTPMCDHRWERGNSGLVRCSRCKETRP